MKTFAALPEDVLILIGLHLLVEDMLALMQTCRVMHALGSSNYLWRELLSDWDIPLDIPSTCVPASLSSGVLRDAAVRSLKLDKRWRDPRVETHHVQRIISENSSFVDGMRLLSGGRWLVTLQYEQAVRTHVILWSMEDMCRPIFKVTVVGRVRFLHADHHHEPGQITIGIAFARNNSESIRVYYVHLQDLSSVSHTVVFDATPIELSPMGRIAGMKINGHVMIAAFASKSLSSECGGQLVCVDLVSKATVAFKCPDWSFPWGRLKIFYQCFAVLRYTRGHTHLSVNISFYELPFLSVPSASSWPKTEVIPCSPIASASWSSDQSLILELSGDTPANDLLACSFTIFGHPIQHTDIGNSKLRILRVSLNDGNIECVPTTVPCRSIPSFGEVKVSSSGKRAVWLSPDPDTQECTLMKFALGRKSVGVGPCVSTLMPSFSGLPFNPRDFHSFEFDEISCKMAVGLSSGELYIMDY